MYQYRLQIKWDYKKILLLLLLLLWLRIGTGGELL
jgi:hypothetical protein